MLKFALCEVIPYALVIMTLGKETFISEDVPNFIVVILVVRKKGVVKEPLKSSV